MPDIRSFFGKSPKSTKEPEGSKKRKKTLVISDSDDDDIVQLPVKKKRTSEEPISSPKSDTKSRPSSAKKATSTKSGVKKVEKSVKKTPNLEISDEDEPAVRKTQNKSLVISDSDDDDVAQIPMKKNKSSKETPTSSKSDGNSNPFLKKAPVKPETKKVEKSVKKKPELEMSDEDKPGVSKKQKKSLVISDSEDDDIPVVPVRKNKTVDKPEKAPKVDVSSFFGSSSIKKTTPKKPEVRKVEQPSKSKEMLDISDDDEIFEDEAFIKSLEKNSTPAAKLSSMRENDKKRKREEKEEDEAQEPIPKEKSKEKPKEAPKPKVEPNLDSSLNESSTASPAAKKNNSYWAYKNREGPKNPGSKEIPEGAANCLEGLTFVITGVLESIERDDATTLIKKYGGRVTSAVSRKTSYVVLGEGAGEKKLEAVRKNGTPTIDEDGLLEMIKSKPGKKSKYEHDTPTPAPKSKAKEEPLTATVSTKKEPLPATSSAKKEPLATSSDKKEPLSATASTKKEPTPSSVAEKGLLKSAPKGKEPAVKREEVPSSALGSEMWTERYRPKRVKDIIGQHGDRSNVNKLLKWLRNWHVWHGPGGKAPFNKDDGSHFKAALLSGPPGVGKTTSATLCAKECGFSYMELNASDARSKKSIKEHVSDLLNNHTITGLTNRGAASDRHVLIMDEVDGMSGNDDRGGVAELISLIKTSRIPILCICNDRNHQKIRSLANYCFDLRFYKPRVEQVKGAMMSIAFKEGLKVPPPAMQQIIEGTNCDIRQILNHLCMWSVDDKAISFDQASADAKKAKKDTKMGIFDIPRLIFASNEETRRYTYSDYTDLFFQDYSLVPLFVQENYPRSRPMRSRGSDYETLKLLSNTADSVCFGDRVSAAIRMQNWSLLPTQAHFSGVMPGFYMRGGLSGMVQFPQVLGQTSKRNRCDGQLRELLNHMILHVNADKRQLGMEYLPILRRKLIQPLIKQETSGVPEVLEVMGEYDMLRDDWDTVMELSTFSPNPNPATKLSTKTKTAFTRMYNKQPNMTPYAVESVAKRKKKAKAGDEGEEGGEEDDDEDGDDDAMIKPVKKKPAPKAKKAPAPKKAAKATSSRAKK